jgi:polyhydroxyalkanoate synthesis regulator phasin
MDSQMRDGMDTLKEAIDDHFTRQHKELDALREEIDGLSRGGTFFSLGSTRWYTSPTSGYRWTSPKDLDWTEGRLHDFHRDVSNRSALLSDEVARLKAKVKQLKEKRDRLRSNCEGALYGLLIVAVVVASALAD